MNCPGWLAAQVCFTHKYLHTRRLYLGDLVTTISNIPQAAPLAIIWGGLKFMLGVRRRTMI